MSLLLCEGPGCELSPEVDSGYCAFHEECAERESFGVSQNTRLNFAVGANGWWGWGGFHLRGQAQETIDQRAAKDQRITWAWMRESGVAQTLRSEYRRQYYLRNRERELDLRRQYRKENRESVAAYMSGYSKRHRKERNAYNRILRARRKQRASPGKPSVPPADSAGGER